ncbi:ribosomal RNA methyltransferase FtsJ domain-containing protein [Phlebopus sp. FC_14]|nr:ribosomal RNA methyltransferase FtsJ domain-containing protein [Phlebopus sp. FC_14]
MSLRPSPVLHQKLSSSSRSWLSRQSRDPYVKERSASLYRSRSAYKLLELDRKWNSFLSNTDVRSVVDLGAAPGGWSQVVAEKLGWINPKTFNAHNPNAESLPAFGLNDDEEVDERISWSARAGRGVIVAVDLLHMSSIPGVQTLQMDFLSPEAVTAVKVALRKPENPSGMADVILSDMAADFSGLKSRDVEMSLKICHSVFEFAKGNLRVQGSREGLLKESSGGTLLLKHFAHPLLQGFCKEFLQPNFKYVQYIKPSASRAESAEGYWLCRGWKGSKS